VRKRHWLVFPLAVVGTLSVFFGAGALIQAQPITHTVEKNGTLWDICEMYYGDPGLWPKLWQMNSFITNPHLLKPGDVLTLLEDIPAKKLPVQREEAPLTEIIDEPVKITGKDVSGMAKVDPIGFLTRGPVASWGHIFSSETKRIMLTKEDRICVEVETAHNVKPGDLFTIYHSSPMLKHPVTGKKLGYVISFLARLELGEQIRKNETQSQSKPLYRAKIVESFRAARVGDLMLPFEPVSSCVQPLASGPELTTRIVAVKDELDLIGQFFVVYVENGYNSGIRRGNLLEIVKKRVVASTQTTTLPDVVLGYLYIVEARPDTATGVVVVAKEEFFNGASVQGLSWETAQGVLSMMPDCIVED